MAATSAHPIYLPLTVNLTGRLVLFVGGGEAALSKLQALNDYKPKLRLVAPEILPQLRQLLESWPQVQILERPFETRDLDSVALGFAFTDDPSGNERVLAQGRKRGIWVNAAQCEDRDFTSPATAKRGHLTLAVSSEGRSISQAVAWKNRFDQLWNQEEV